MCEHKHRFAMLKGERLSDGKYRLVGLPKGSNFRDEGSYQDLACGPLKVEGVAFAAASFDFGEHNVDIVVERKSIGGLTNITFEESE